MRDAFGVHDDSQRRLEAEVASLGPHKVREGEGRI